ncbi:thiamine pyrophosphate-binding protein [Novosphingobium sp. SG707]|uniref:thiamine pyrophosphate-binding protein n=1 Tax=Novosphingobium sp. SG707 TaxID=2586996 RepID=UPI001447B4FD|nr:thiamine pyrophosphate-binding protein [Novosphingobium sp. SG707]NKJ00958.1 thiamine pyrophosphate-dependent acetolactate synthase large subunit-like protein [Novosphingobium sp. SG707]
MAIQAVKTLKVHQAIAKALVDNGAQTMFGLIGEANLYMANSFVEDFGGSYIAAAHESGAATMALGYSLMSGKVGIATVTVGPALINTLTALVEGVKGSVPMLLLCGDTPQDDRDSIQKVSQREFIMATGAGFEQLRSPKTVAQDVATALRRAMTERRPIVLNMPVEMQWSEVEYQPVHYHVPDNRPVVSAGDELDKAIGIIAAAKRPIVLAGRGAISPEAKAALLKLAARIEAPLATTLKARGLFDGEDYNLGIFGTLSSTAAVDVIMQSDCVIAFGASLNILTTSHGTFLKGKRVVEVNLDSGDVGKNVSSDAALAGDPAGTAEIFLHWLDEAEIPASGFRNEIDRVIPLDSQLSAPVADAHAGTVDFLQALAVLDRLLPADRVLVTDGGRFGRETWKRIKAPGPSSFVTTTNFGSIGLGLSHAVGASFAAAGRPIVLFTGDGGFMHGGLAEFNTAVRYGIKLIVILCNDGAYGAEHVHFMKREIDPRLCLFKWPDFAPLAVALGGTGFTVRSQAELEVVLESLADQQYPVLIDMKLDPDRMPAY